MKISKLLPITLALVLGMSCAYADPATKAQADYELTLNPFFNVTHLGTNQESNVSYNDAYTVATIDSGLTGAYTVITNESTNIYLYGACKANDGNAHALYGTAEGLKLVFTNENPEQSAHLLTKTQVGDMMKSASPELSPNAVAFNLTVTPELVENTYPAGGKITRDTELIDNSLKFSLPNCNSTFTYSVAGTSVDSSFSTLDQKGTYKATLYLTNAQPAAAL